MRPGLRIVLPELCSCGERPANAASPLGVNSPMFGSSANSTGAVTAPMPGMLNSRSWLRLSTGSVATKACTAPMIASTCRSSQSR